MTVYSIMYNGKCEEAYSLKEFRELLETAHICKCAFNHHGHILTLKENEKSRRNGWVERIENGVPLRQKGYPRYRYDIHWDALEKMIDGAYGN